MHTKTSENNKLIFLLTGTQSSGCETGFPSYNLKAGDAVTKQEGLVLNQARL